MQENAPEQPERRSAPAPPCHSSLRSRLAPWRRATTCSVSPMTSDCAPCPPAPAEAPRGCRRLRRRRCRSTASRPRPSQCSLPLQLVRSGARDELKQLARQRLEESGWTDEVRQLCRGARLWERQLLPAAPCCCLKHRSGPLLPSAATCRDCMRTAPQHRSMARRPHAMPSPRTLCRVCGAAGGRGRASRRHCGGGQARRARQGAGPPEGRAAAGAWAAAGRGCRRLQGFGVGRVCCWPESSWRHLLPVRACCARLGTPRCSLLPRSASKMFWGAEAQP